MPSTFLPRTRIRLGAILAVAGLFALATTVPALGAGEPTALSVNPPGPTKSATLTFTWGPPADAPPSGLPLTGYQGGLVPDGGAAPADAISPGVVYGDDEPLPDGTYDFHVAAVFSDGVATEIAPVSLQNIVVDRTPPSLSLALSPSTANGDNGWYTSLSILRTCGDGGGSGVASCGPIPWSTDRASGPFTATVTDAAGNESAPASVTFKYDATRPSTAGGQPSTPGPAALVAAEPAFAWTPGVDATSGPARYELQYKIASAGDETYVTIARRTDNGGVGDYTARRGDGITGTPSALPERTLLKWRVVTYDAAGNSRASDPREIRIDSTIPPAPTITGGPSSPTRTTSPTFSWTGAEETFLWDLTVAGTESPARRGGGVARQVTIPNLPDGSYTFRVSQVTEAGRPSAEATRAFTVDTTAPAPPTILVRPPFPAISAPVFTWSTESGAYSRWTVLGEGGAIVVPSTDTPSTSAVLPSLADGAYSFQVRQIDAAGNVSAPTVEPFTMLAPLSPAPGPSTTAAASVLPRQNAKRLRPRAGARVPTRSPVLRWKKGPRGTRLYNLQMFRVIKRRGAAPKVTKILSVFPRGLQIRAPKKRLRASTCYVWRVWPYTGRSFTPKPVGVSNFCVASSKVLKRKAAQIRAKKLAAARRAALARKAAPRR